MKYSPIWKDIVFTSATDTDFELVEGTDVIADGLAKSQPGIGVEININPKTEEYIKPDFETDFREGGVIPNPDGVKSFKLYDSGNQVEEYRFLYDWSYEDNWSGQSDYNMSQAINGHMDPRMMCMFTNYDSAETGVDYSIEWVSYLRLHPNYITFPANGGVKTIEVESNDEWEITSIPEWISANVTAGTGNTVVTLTAASNPRGYDRTDGLVFTYPDGTAALGVLQHSVIHLSVTPNSLNVPYSGGTYSVDIESNVDWISVSPEWAQVSPVSGTGDTTVSVEVDTNASFKQRTGDVVVVGGGERRNVGITQDENTPSISVVPSSYNFAYTGGTVMVTITSNCDWDIENLPSWLTVSQMSGTTGTTVIYVEADESGLLYQRAGDVAVYYKTTSASIHITQEAAPNPSLRDYLTFNITSPGNIVWEYRNPSPSLGTGVTAVISYSINDGGWISIRSSSAGTSFSVNQGDVVKFKGDNTNYSYVGEKSGVSYDYFNDFSGTTAGFTLSGNINSLIDSEHFDSITALNEQAFSMLFYMCTGLTDASALLLPVVNLSGASGCYRFMFNRCSNLTRPPELPATTLSDGCYEGMFYRCTSLASAPELLATTLASGCYERMFDDCQSLTTAPELSVTTLATDCYKYMFWNCISLTTAPELPATTLASGCYQGMFDNCRSLTTAPELPATTLAEKCYAGMFNRCALTTTPELPVTTLADGCYDGMFWSCTSLTTAPELPATTLASGCYKQMFYNCTSLTTAPELPATTLEDSCYEQMFQRCASLTMAPELPATTLASACYQGMFSACTNLSYVKCLATDRSASNCTTNWLNNVASSGTFVKNPSMSSWPSGISGIPNNWTVIDAQ